ncbi:MAG TPA: hypothetical protein VIV09_12465, partial [Pseudolabrys sp.]
GRGAAECGVPLMTMIEEMARAAFNERFRHNVGVRWEETSEADRRAHRDMIAGALGCLREPNKAMLEDGAAIMMRLMPDIGQQFAMGCARRVMSVMAETAIREAEEAGQLTP